MFTYTPGQIPQKIVVVGGGGTGSRLIPMLVQFIRSITNGHNPMGWLMDPTIYIVDDDVVEYKNLMRQNFIEADVGKPKAAVLAQRYSRAYGIKVEPIIQRLTDSTSTIVDGSGSRIDLTGAMWILCVDSAAARRDILKVIIRNTNTGNGSPASMSPFIIDAGNENTFGQVKFFNLCCGYGYQNDLKKFEFPKMLPFPSPIDAIPMPMQFYRDLEDTPGQGSCADLDQTLAINASMAVTIVGIVQNFYYRRPFKYNEVFISLDGDGYTKFNTIADITGRVSTERTFLGANIPGYVDMYNTYKDYFDKIRKDIARREKEALQAQREAEAKRKAEEAERNAAKAAVAEVLEDKNAPSAPPMIKKPKKAKKAQAEESLPLPGLPPSGVPELVVTSRAERV